MLAEPATVSLLLLLLGLLLLQRPLGSTWLPLNRT
jgi:hypothetical protein